MRPEIKRLLKKLIKAQKQQGDGPLLKNTNCIDGLFDGDFDLRDLAESG